MATQEFIKVLTFEQDTISCISENTVPVVLVDDTLIVSLSEDVNIVAPVDADQVQVLTAEDSFLVVSDNLVDFNQVFLQDSGVTVVQLTDDVVSVKLAEAFVGFLPETLPEDTLFFYNPDGSVEHLIVGGIRTDFTYDVDGVLINLFTDVFQQNFTYNPDGSVDKITVVFS